jgi:hypothetical protein
MPTNETSDVARALYACISGPAGAPRNWELHDSLFAPGGHSYVLHRTADGHRQAEVLTPAQYRSTRQPYFDSNDFYEVETAHQVTIRGDIAHAFSEYESRRTPEGPAFDGGVNGIMFVRIAGLWRVTSIAWEAGPIATALWAARRPEG